MRPTVIALFRASFMLVITAGLASAQTETLMYDHVHLTVPDPQATAAWYQQHLGGEFLEDQDDRVLVGTTRIVFMPGEGRRPSAGSGVDHLGFSFSDLEAKVQELEGAGATVTTAPREVPGLFKLAFMDDPWGTRLELIEDVQHLGFHHLHLRSADPEATLAWYHEHFGGFRTPLRGRLDGLLYPGNVWLLVQRADEIPGQATTIDHLGWRTPDAAEKVEELRRKGVTIDSEPRSMEMPAGEITYSFIRGPDGVRLEIVQRAPEMR